MSGVTYVGLEQEKEAVSAFETAVKLNPNDFESLASLGQIYYIDSEKSFSKDDVEKSVNYFKEALKLNPDCYLYHYYIGLNYLQINDYTSAIDSFNSAIKLKSDDYNSRYYRAISHAGFSNCPAMMLPGVSLCSSSALATAPDMPSAPGVSTIWAP